MHPSLFLKSKCRDSFMLSLKLECTYWIQGAALENYEHPCLERSFEQFCQLLLNILPKCAGKHFPGFSIMVFGVKIQTLITRSRGGAGE